MAKQTINISKIVGRGYYEFWNFKGRYLVCKGGRGSKKSKTAALKIMDQLTKYPLSNALIIRQTFNTLQQSCWSELQWAAEQLGVRDRWVFNKSPLQAVNKITGQQIIFRGLDDPLGITSLTVQIGVLNYVWIEEAYQIQSEDAFNKLDMSIRGQLPNGYFKQIILTFNPWSQHHWLKARFFDVEDPNILALTTNYLVNEFLGKDDLKLFEDMKETDPQRYSCEGLGNWGSVSGLIYTRFRTECFNLSEVEKMSGAKEYFGLDFGFINDPTAFLRVIVIEKEKRIYVMEELLYETGLTNPDIYKKIKATGYQNRTIIADQEFKSIAELQKLGCHNMRACKKGPNYKIATVKQLNQYQIIIHNSCTNFLMEISNYAWVVNRQGIVQEKLPDGNDHLLDAFIYAMQGVGTTVKTSSVDLKRKLKIR